MPLRRHALTARSPWARAGGLQVYRFRSDDEARGSPVRAGRGGRTVWSKTWHTTLLAQVGRVPAAASPPAAAAAPSRGSCHSFRGG